MRTPTDRMLPPSYEDLPDSSLGVHDILFILFKYKRTILACTVLGLIAAAAVFFNSPRVYQSQAKLLVRYFVERSAVDAVDTTSNSAGNRGLTVSALASEVEILTSWDLAVQVAETIGPKRLLSNASVAAADAAGVVAKGLQVEAQKEGNILLVSYQNNDPELTTLVLQDLVSHYFVKHLEVHRSAGAFDFVSQQTDQVKARLNETEDALKPLKAQAGIISLADSNTTLSAELARTQEQLHAAESELAEQEARVKELDESPTPPAPTQGEAEPGTAQSAPPRAPNRSQSEPAPPKVVSTPGKVAPSGQAQQYQVVVARLEQLRQTKLDLLSKYTARSVQVRLNQNQILDLERQRADLEKKFPDLPDTVRKTGTGTGAGTGRQSVDLVSERVGLAGLVAKVEALRARFSQVQAKVKQLNDLGPRIAELERKKELEEANYKYFQGTLEKARVDEALDPSKIPNISIVQKPSPPRKVTTKRNKLVLALAGGGLAIGLALALLFDLVLNRTVKRPLELEKQLHVPLLLSIPYARRDSQLRLPAGTDGKELEPYRNGNGNNEAAVAPWSAGHFIQPYAQAIRDRLGLYFELHHLTHKPKLVGVAGFVAGAGTSTLAAGLASALSETDDGKVLLVDVNLGPGHVHPFFEGKPAYSLATALQPSGTIDAAADNLYLATVGSAKTGPAQLGLKRFFDLMPNLKASDFDYIIFDMPPLEQTSPTWALSPFMDKMLLIVQGDTTDRDAVKRGYRKLTTERDNVAVVFNKEQSYGPGWIQGEN